jgi:poly(3-hydroxybutyrate) depolymerase
LGTLLPRNDGTLQGELLTFDQGEFITGQSMDSTGYAFVPAACASGEECRLHVSFHGCEQGASTSGVGTDYVKNSGFNKWADTNNIIVLYPQAKASSTNPSNPNGSVAF